jgi:hypothetical protein
VILVLRTTSLNAKQPTFSAIHNKQSNWQLVTNRISATHVTDQDQAEFRPAVFNGRGLGFEADDVLESNAGFPFWTRAQTIMFVPTSNYQHIDTTVAHYKGHVFKTNDSDSYNDKQLIKL